MHILNQYCVNLCQQVSRTRPRAALLNITKLGVSAGYQWHGVPSLTCLCCQTLLCDVSRPDGRSWISTDPQPWFQCLGGLLPTADGLLQPGHAADAGPGSSGERGRARLHLSPLQPLFQHFYSFFIFACFSTNRTIRRLPRWKTWNRG